MKSIILFLSLTCFFTACSRQDKVDQNIVGQDNIFQEDIERTIDQNDKIREQFSERVIMNQVSIRQRNKFAGAVENTRIYLALLLRSPDNRDALKKLNLNRMVLQSMAFQRRDFEFVDFFLKDLRLLILDIAQYQGQVLEDLVWNLYQDNFETGIDLYTTINGKSSWNLGNHNRKSYISIKSKDTSSWFITPKINLLHVHNPSIQIEQVFNLKLNSDQILDKKKLRSAIKVLVSRNYEYGDPEKANWQELDLGKFPFVSDFNPHKSKLLNLSDYKNDIISIAFKLDLDYNYHGGHSLLWQVNNIALHGASDREDFIIPRKDPTTYIYQYDFSQGVDAFTQVSLGDNPAEFKDKSRNGNSYVEVSGFTDKNNGAVYLISPEIELGQDESFVKVNQGINFYKQAAKEKNYIQILMGTSKDDLQAIEWEELEFQKTPNGDNWTPVESEWLKLNRKNEKIRIAFRYESGNGLSEYPNWSLFSLDLKEEK